MKYNVLILGSGGREHAMAWVFSKDKKVDKVFCAPGNGGTENIAQNIKINLVNHQEVIRVAQNNNIDLTVVGPEVPLSEGIVDSFKKENMRIFGPDSYGAQLESSKLFARDLMAENGIPQPLYYSCNTRNDIESLKKILGLPLVLKADGLAAGKGVIVCHTEKEYRQALKDVFDKQKFGRASNRISLERCLIGEELSVFAVCDGKDFIVLNSAQDHKRAFDDDKGPNTGGMGAYSPTPLSNQNLIKCVEKEIIEPTLNAMIKRGHPYVGFLYIGLMIVDNKPYVIEFNVRMGDPETQAVFPLLESSIFDLLWNASNGKLKNTKIKNSDQTAVAIVLAAEGYPSDYSKGLKIIGLESLDKALIFHAGTEKRGHEYFSTGGRVLNVVGLGKTLKTALKDAYGIVDKINFEGKFYRKDIGFRGLKVSKKEV